MSLKQVPQGGAPQQLCVVKTIEINGCMAMLLGMNWLNKFRLGSGLQWWRKRLSSGILSEQAGFISRDGLGFFSIQNCCESILAGRWAFSKEQGIDRCICTLPSSFLFPITNVKILSFVT